MFDDTLGVPAGGVQKSFDDSGIALQDVTFCVLDFETTGSSPDLDRITEIGAAKYRGGECLGTFQTLVNPGCAVPPFITVLTGITDAMLIPAPRIESVLGSLVHFIGDAVIVAHNARFDMSFLAAALARDGRDELTNKVVDTVHLARRLVRDEVPDCKLATLASRLRLEHQPSHRALDDVLATGDLLHALLERAAGFGVMGLDDLIGLPRLETHPMAAKLRLTENLPRCPGVYMFLDARHRVLYVGKASNLRQRVRSYFSTSETRRKIGPMLRQVSSIVHIPTPDSLTASVYESRLIQRLLPQYNRTGTTVDRYCYVRLTLDEEWPRLVITKKAARTGLHIGPLTSRTVARLVIEAIESAIPLRRCTARLGRSYVPAPDAPVCSAAQLGVAMCPCSGTADRDEYQTIVSSAVDALTKSPMVIFDHLLDRMQQLARTQRYEEAASLRDRMLALESTLVRQRRLEQMRTAGHIELVVGDVCYQFEGGILTGTQLDDQLFFPVVVAGNDGVGLGDDVSTLLGPSADDVASCTDLASPIARTALDELVHVGRFLDDLGLDARLISCSGTWAMPVANVPILRKIDSQLAA